MRPASEAVEPASQVGALWRIYLEVPEGRRQKDSLGAVARAVLDIASEDGKPSLRLLVARITSASERSRSVEVWLSDSAADAVRAAVLSMAQRRRAHERTCIAPYSGPGGYSWTELLERWAECIDFGRSHYARGAA